MELFEAIARRHSYRGPYDRTPVPRADLQRIVQAGLQAPSAKNTQTTHFVIVDDPDLVHKINAMSESNRAIQEAPAFIACLIDTHPAAILAGSHFQIEDCAAAVENTLLAITALGYAAVWIDGWLRAPGRAAAIRDLLHAPPEKTVRVLVPIGRPRESWEQAERLPFEKRAWFNRYDEA